jgi:hypothetical protein
MVRRAIINRCGFLFLLLFSNIAIATTPDQLFTDRVVAISEPFLDKPYQLEPLGEGPNGQFNQEPLSRFDAFDCETYVDTVLALASSKNDAGFQQNIIAIRYADAQPNFFTRNHFPEGDWLPNNERKGYLKDITAQIAPPSQCVTQTMMINRQQWYKNLTGDRIKINGLSSLQLQQKIDQLHAHSKQVNNETITLTYIRSNAVAEISKQIPNGAIIMIIKPQHILGTDMLISHMGFAVWRDNQLYLRAASSWYGRVVDLPLIDYLQQKPKVHGVVILLPLAVHV